MNQKRPAPSHDHVSHDGHTHAPVLQTEGDASRILSSAFNRRVVMKAAAAFSAIAAAGGIGATSSMKPLAVKAAENGGTRANRYTPGTATSTFSAASIGDWETFQTDFPFYALGVSWDGSVGSWPVVELEISTDGVSWGETYRLAENHEDGGQPTRDGRLFTPLIFTSGESWVRYRTVDADGNPGVVTDLSFSYIDATDGPWENDVDSALEASVEASSEETTFSAASTGDDRIPPSIVTREAWGADESYRYDTYGEVWPPEYDKVHHIIVHHTDTPTSQDPIVAIRSIYWYHAVDQGWGDIGYNYLIDRNGRIYEGRYGGQNVIGGHSYEYANGSSGICIIGDYQDSAPSSNALAGLVAIISWVGRDLNPYGRQDFLEAPDLPIISAHRDVNSTTCPGNLLYADLPQIRSLVAATINAGTRDSGNPGGIVVRDRVVVQTDDGAPLNVRNQAGRQYTVIAQLKNGSAATVIDGPVGQYDNWYKIAWGSSSGWVMAQYLIVVPPAPAAIGEFSFGQNIRFTSETNIRTQPSTTASIVGTVPRNTWAFVMAGPTERNGYTWYQVRAYQVGDGWSIADNLMAAPTNTSPSAKFVVGDVVAATEDANIRPRPGIAQTITAMAYSGTQMTITRPAFGVTERVWYGVYGSFGGGWAVQDTLRAVSSQTSRFKIAEKVNTIEVVNYRATPELNAKIIAKVKSGDRLVVIGAPQVKDGYAWYPLMGSGGTAGWAVSTALSFSTGVVTGKFSIGQRVHTSTTMSLRTGPTANAPLITTVAKGGAFDIKAGAVSVGGYLWYQVRGTGGTWGWAIQDAFVGDGTTPPPSNNKFAIGDAIRVTEDLNLRSSASTSGSVISVLSAGTSLTVVGGPTTANGYTWYQVRTSGGTTGWAVQDWLAKTTSGGGSSNKFATGNTVRVTEDLNLRSSASTSGSVVTVLTAGTTLTVIGGPSTGSGYTWYHVRTSGGTSGWAVQDWLTKV